MALTDSPRKIALAIAESLRRFRRRIRTSLTGFADMRGYVPDKLLIAPQELRTADPTLAQELYGGRYFFAGVTVECGGENPFLLEAANESWARKLHQFTWIRHLAASNDNLAARHARTLIMDWITIHGRGQGEIVWEVETSARRLIAWLNNSVTIVSGAELEAYRRFLRAIGYHVKFLKTHAGSAPEGIPRLVAHVALAYASVCLSGGEKASKPVWDKLDQILDDQIYPDGGHVSRNPEMVADILSLLLPLRQSCTAAGRTPSKSLIAAIERLLPALRYFRLGDGALARFNGSGNAEYDLIATLLRYDESLGSPLLDASQSGYQRMVVGDTQVLMDVGNPPTRELSVRAHAGCLSFEFSSAEEMIVVNCGAPPQPERYDEPVWRSTAAHSTVVLNDTSSCKFDNSGPVGRFLGGQIYSGVLKAESRREDVPEFSLVTGSHRGYVSDFGIRHTRVLQLDTNGERLAGIDRFTNAYGKELSHLTRDAVAARFHFHPDVKLEASGGNSVSVKLRSGRVWQFFCEAVTPHIEESIFFASVSGPRKCQQLVLNVKAMEVPELKWHLIKLS